MTHLVTNGVQGTHGKVAEQMIGPPTILPSREKLMGPGYGDEEVLGCHAAPRTVCGHVTGSLPILKYGGMQRISPESP